MDKKTIPAISVIIPMYNAEKYVSECLDSILAQTFTDYEVIVVDNCSTDNSCKIVESYAPKFTNGGVERLQLVRRNVNSGNATVPRNTGLKIAHGKYIFFVDSDDAITKTALEELFKPAEKFQADVIHLGAFFRLAENDSAKNYKKSQPVIGGKNITVVKEPTAFKGDLAERVRNFGNGKFNTTPWNYLFRRDFLMDNNIIFPDLKHGEDELFDFCAICLAKKFLLVPNVVYIYRIRQDSMNRQTVSPENYVHDWFGSTLKAISLYENFMNKFDSFQKNPELKYIVFELFANHNTTHHLQIYTQIPPFQLDALIRRELEQIEDKTALTAFLFNRMNIFNVNLLQQQNLIRQQQAQIQQLQQNQNNFGGEDIFKL